MAIKIIKIDIVFKNIFGSEKNPKILISFLNETLKPKYLITSVEMKKFTPSSYCQRLSLNMCSDLSRWSNTNITIW